MAKKKKEPTNPLTPIALLGATWLATQAATVVFERTTGKPAPIKGKAKDDIDPLRNLVWTLGLTAVIALTEVVITNLLEDND